MALQRNTSIGFALQASNIFSPLLQSSRSSSNFISVSGGRVALCFHCTVQYMEPSFTFSVYKEALCPLLL